jgi:hypothetical protein
MPVYPIHKSFTDAVPLDAGMKSVSPRFLKIGFMLAQEAFMKAKKTAPPVGGAVVDL